MANKTPILTVAELQSYLGNTNASAALLKSHNQMAINILCEILGVIDIIEHSVVKEEVQVLDDGYIIEICDFPLKENTLVLYNELNVRIDSDILVRYDSHSEKFLHLVDSEGRKNKTGYKTGQVYANYVGGYLLADVPEQLKFACALIAGGSLSNAEKVGGVVEYSLGQKTVKFRSENEAKQAYFILEQYLKSYLSINVYS